MHMNLLKSTNVFYMKREKVSDYFINKFVDLQFVSDFLTSLLCKINILNISHVNDLFLSCRKVLFFGSK